jgi:hypothetical protein
MLSNNRVCSLKKPSIINTDYLIQSVNLPLKFKKYSYDSKSCY